MKKLLMLILLNYCYNNLCLGQFIEKSTPFRMIVKNNNIILPDSIFGVIKSGKVFVHLTINKKGKVQNFNIIKLTLKTCNNNVDFYNENLFLDNSTNVPLEVIKLKPFVKIKLQELVIVKNKYATLDTKNYGVIPFNLINK